MHAPPLISCSALTLPCLIPPECWSDVEQQGYGHGMRNGVGSSICGSGKGRTSGRFVGCMIALSMSMINGVVVEIENKGFGVEEMKESRKSAIRCV